MGLSSELISQLVRATNTNTETNKESIVYGTITENDGKQYVRLDGSSMITPISSTVDMADGERVTVLLKNHSATVTGNITSPAGKSSELKEVRKVVETIEAGTVTAEQLKVEQARITKLETGKLDATVAQATYATITQLTAANAEITSLKTDKISAKDIEGKYANIDFSNITEATMASFYAKSGLIQNVTVSDATITGELVGVTIKGDLIESNTLVADKLVIKGTDGLYYKLNTDGVTTEAEQTDYNSLNGSVITANSITASKISVDDLVAFDATIGGFNITENSIYSGVKSSVGNTTRGLYLDNTGQIALGDADKFIRYYKDANGTYKLVVIADSLVFGSSKTSVETAINSAQSSADAAQADVDTLTTRVTTAETAISQNEKALSLTATKTEVSTAKAEAIQSASTDATTKANKALTDANTNTATLLKDYSTTEEMNAAIKVQADSITSSVSSTYATKSALNTTNTNVTKAQTAATNAATAAANAQADIDGLEIGGTNLYKGTKTFDTAYWTVKDTEPYELDDNFVQAVFYLPSDNIPYPQTLTSVQGFDFSDTTKTWTISAMFKGSADGQTIGITLDGGRIGWKPQALDNGSWKKISWTFQGSTNLTKFRFQGGTGVSNDNPIRIAQIKVELGNKATDWSPAPEDVDTDISNLDTRVKAAESSITQLSNKITANVTETTNLGTRMSTVEQTASNLTVRLTTAETDIDTAQSTANTAKTNAATAQSTANTAKANAATAQTTANTAKTNAATAQTAADNAQADIDNLAIGGRNLIIRSTEQKDYWINTSGIVETCTSYYMSAVSDYIAVEPSTSYMLTRKESTAADGGFFRMAWYDENKTYISRAAYGDLENCITSPSNACYIRIAYPYDAYPKCEKGNRATDWSPAPEDVDSDISDAAKTATDYMNLSSAGLVVGQNPSSPTAGNTLISTDGVSIRKGTTVLAAFKAASRTASGITSATLTSKDLTDSDSDGATSVSGTVTTGGTRANVYITTNGNPVYFPNGLETDKVLINSNGIISNDNILLNGSLVDKTGEGIFTPINSYGNTVIGYGRYEDGGGTHIYGNLVKAKTKAGFSASVNGAAALDTNNSSGNATFGWHLYEASSGETNIYGNIVSLFSKDDIRINANTNNVRVNGDIVPYAANTFSIGNTTLPMYDLVMSNKTVTGVTHGLKFSNGTTAYNAVVTDGNGYLVYGNTSQCTNIVGRSTTTSSTGYSFKITCGHNPALDIDDNDARLLLFGGTDSTSRYLGSMAVYKRTYSNAGNIYITNNGMMGRSTSSSQRYKKDIVDLELDTVKGLYDLPVRQFKYRTEHISQDDERYERDMPGFIAEEVAECLPIACDHIPDEDGNMVPEMWNSKIIIPSLLKLIQDLNDRVKTLEGKEV